MASLRDEKTRWEHRIEGALQPDAFIPYGAAFAFVRDEVIEQAWADFRAHPSAYTYADLMKFVPEAERAPWHGKAIEAAEGADIQSLLHLLAETGEVDRLAAAVRRATDAGLEGVSHHVGEWQRIVAFVRVEHRRKRGFMDGFEEVVAGGGPSQRPSFLERAKARWGEGDR